MTWSRIFDNGVDFADFSYRKLVFLRAHANISSKRKPSEILQHLNKVSRWAKIMKETGAKKLDTVKVSKAIKQMAASGLELAALRL